MEGVYDNFPNLYHGIALFSIRTSPKNLQKIMIQLFSRINREDEFLNVLTPASRGIRLVPEIGIAEGIAFNFIDEEERNRWLENLEKKVFEVLDFIWIMRYYVPGKEKDKPLKFDYYLLRFIFRRGAMELRVHHEKGPRRLSTEDLIRLISDELNRELEGNGEPRLEIESLSAF